MGERVNGVDVDKWLKRYPELEYVAKVGFDAIEVIHKKSGLKLAFSLNEVAAKSKWLRLRLQYFNKHGTMKGY